MMNIGVGGGHEYGDEMLTEMPGWGDELMRKTDHKVANDYSGKEKRHTDFWGNPPEQIVNILWNIKSGIFLWKSKTPTCNPTLTLSTPHRGRGRRSWSCAWSRWSSILASFSEGTAPHCLKKWNCESESITLKMHHFLGEPLLIVWKSESERIALKWHHFLRE